MGRVMNSLLFLTDCTRTVYAPECSAWYVHNAPDQKAKAQPTQEVCGIRSFALLERALGAIGVRGLDRLFAFRAVHELNQFLKFYSAEVHPFRTLLDQVREALYPEYKVVANASKLYSGAMKKVEKLMGPILRTVCNLGQGQLIRRQIANLLQFGCQMDAHLLYQALDTFNKGVVSEIRRHYRSPDKHPYPARDNPLLFETNTLLEAGGMDDPLHKIYITSQPLEGLPVLLFLFLLTYLPKVIFQSICPVCIFNCLTVVIVVFGSLNTTSISEPWFARKPFIHWTVCH
jgi:WASH complex subunit strumpellin